MYKFYDTACDGCGKWYGEGQLPPNAQNVNDAREEMRRNGWKFRGGKTCCDKCASKQGNR